MLKIVLLIAGIWKTLALPGIHRYQPLQFPQLDPEKFDAWKRAELTAAYVFIAATWGALLVEIVVSVWYARQLEEWQISANVAESRLWNFTIGIAVAWLVGIVIAAAYGSRAKALKKAATLVTPVDLATPTTGQRREQSPAEAAAASDLWEELEAIARAQRVILWCVLVNLVGFGLSFAFAPAFAEHPELRGIWLLLGIALAVFQAFWVWRLAARLGSGVGILWACGAFVPGLSIILLIVLMVSATTRLKAAGIAVGLMGASLDQFQRPRLVTPVDLATPTTGQRREQSPAEAAAASDLWEELEAIARAQRVILWCVLVNLVGFGLSFAFAPAFAEHPELRGFWLLLGIALAVFTAFWVWRLAARLGSGVGILWACGAVVPGLSIILLLVLMVSATTRLKAAGIAVGLMGASLDQFQRPREEVRHGAR